MTDQRAKRRKGYYDGKYASVTTVLKIVHKEALLLWLQRKIFEATKEGAATFSEAKNEVFNSSKKIMKLGTDVHKYAEIYEKKESILITEEMKPFIDAYHLYLIDYSPKDIHNEITLFNDEYLYAGTADKVVEINGETWLIDIKTGKSAYQITELQLTAYKMSYDLKYPDKPIDKMAVVLLKKDRSGAGTGEYEFKEMNYLPKVWIAALRLFYWDKGIETV